MAKSPIQELMDRVKELETALKTKADKTDLNNKADKSDLTNLDDRLKKLEQKIKAMNASITGFSASITGASASLTGACASFGVAYASGWAISQSLVGASGSMSGHKFDQKGLAEEAAALKLDAKINSNYQAALRNANIALEQFSAGLQNAINAMNNQA